jgi:hypothetical protein
MKELEKQRRDPAWALPHNRKWGLFSMAIPTRVGYQVCVALLCCKWWRQSWISAPLFLTAQCRDHYESLIKKGLLHDPVYYRNENDRMCIRNSGCM